MLLHGKSDHSWISSRVIAPNKKLEAPNKKLLTKLYNLEASEDEVIVSDCGLQDLSIKPFLDSLIS